MFILQAILIFIFSFLVQVQAISLGWDVELVLPCLIALAAFLPFEKYLLFSLTALFVVRWSPSIFSPEIWLYLGFYLLAYGLRQILPLRSWASVLASVLIFEGLFVWIYGSTWSYAETVFLLSAAAIWSIGIFAVLRGLLKYPTLPRIKFSHLRSP
ncbi:MAG: hypothetical protein V1856_03370 [Candidatus Liptonbacteria bacterium]